VKLWTESNIKLSSLQI